MKTKRRGSKTNKTSPSSAATAPVMSSGGNSAEASRKGREDAVPMVLPCASCKRSFHMGSVKHPPAPNNASRKDWRCDACKPAKNKLDLDDNGDDVDGLKALVMSLPESIRSRFGEICWAQGGSGYGWWPSLIYDPRRAGEPARTQARRFLGSRFLVYFIECPESPFSLLDNSQIKPWIEGLSDDLHLGKSAKHGGKMKLLAFQRALLTATDLSEKPLEERLGYSNDDEDEPEMFARQTRSQRAKLVEGSPRSAFQPIRPAATSAASPSVKRSLSFPQRDGSRRRVSNDGFVVPIPSNAQAHEVSSDTPEDDEMVCKIIMKASQGRKEKSIGIVLLPSIHTSTFAHIRAKIKEELCGDLLPAHLVWKFFLMEAGVPVSVKQEVKLGPVHKLLSKGRKDASTIGTLTDPILVYISDKV